MQLFKIAFSQFFYIYSILLFGFGLGLLNPLSFAGEREEPRFCELSEFLKKEDLSIRDNPKLIRARGFRLGDVTLVGLSVGRSEVKEVIELAHSHDRLKDIAAKNYCTWYLHYPTPALPYFLNSLYAMQKFNFAPILRNPKDLSAAQAVAEVMSSLDGVFAGENPSFLGCLTENKFLAVGCQGMAHRGPTVFGAVLALMGCSPQHSAEIVNFLWGLNGVAPEVRKAVLEAAYELGNSVSSTQKWVPLRW
jgi:hypothetical protein